MTDPTYTPDPALVRHVVARVIDGAPTVLASTISEHTLTGDERDGLDPDQQAAVTRAVQDMLGNVQLGYVLPGHADHQADPDEPETARLTADVVLFGGPADNLHVLLIKRGWDPYEGHWALPGGHIDPGETPLAAACRELAEETGLHIRPADLRLVNVYADPGRDPRGRYATWVYTLTLTHQPPPTAGDDAEAAQWVPLDRALSAESRLAFDHERIIREAARVTAPAESLRP